VEVVARLPDEQERNKKSAYPEDQDRHRSAYREAGDVPHAGVLRVIRVSL
jgi:hypothetical protein